MSHNSKLLYERVTLQAMSGRPEEAGAMVEQVLSRAKFQQHKLNHMWRVQLDRESKLAGRKSGARSGLYRRSKRKAAEAFWKRHRSHALYAKKECRSV